MGEGEGDCASDAFHLVEGRDDTQDSQWDVWSQEDSHGNLWNYGVNGGDILSWHVEETVKNEAYSCHHATVRMEGNVVKKKSLTKRVLILVHHGNLCQVEVVSFVFGESEGKLKMIVGRMNKMIYNIIILGYLVKQMKIAIDIKRLCKKRYASRNETCSIRW